MPPMLAAAVGHIKRGWRAFIAMTCRERIYVTLAVLALISSGMAQIFIMNEWEQLFCNGATPWLGTFTMCATAVAAFYVPFFGIWCLWKRPNVSFLLSRRAIMLAVSIGLCDALNGIFMFRAAEDAPEILQTFLTATSVFWTFLAVKFIAGDDRSYLSPLVIIAFLCTAGGTVVASVAQFGNTKMTTDAKLWTLIYEVGIMLGAFYTVFAYMFLSGFSPKVGVSDSGRRLRSSSRGSLPSEREHLNAKLNGSNNNNYNSSGGEPVVGEAEKQQQEEEEEDDVDARAVAGTEGKPKEVYKVNLGSHLTDFEASVTIKLGMMAMGLSCQLVWLWALVPVDAIPWFGDAPSVGHAYYKIQLGWEAAWDSTVCENHNGLYGFFFCAFAILQYAGVLYLNTYSAPLTSMVQQLVSPCAAVFLLILPAWNVSNPPMTISTWQTLLAIVLLVVGTLLFSAWEESTKPKELVAINETTTTSKH